MIWVNWTFNTKNTTLIREDKEDKVFFFLLLFMAQFVFNFRFSSFCGWRFAPDTGFTWLDKLNLYDLKIRQGGKVFCY